MAVDYTDGLLVERQHSLIRSAMHTPRITADPRLAYQPLIVVLLAACAGIAADRWLAWPVLVWCALAALGWGAWHTLWRRERWNLAAVAILVSTAAVGGAWHHVRWSLFDETELARSAPRQSGPVALRVRALGGPRRIPPPPPDVFRAFTPPERTRIEVRALAVRDRDAWLPAEGNTTLLVGGSAGHVRAGDELLVFGEFARTRAPANPGEFDFAALARSSRQLVTLSCDFPECVTVERSTWSLVPRETIDWLRTAGDSLLWRNLGARQSPLATAMFLGARDELDPDLRQAFVETGTVHLLVVSGLNVGILAATLFLLMRWTTIPLGAQMALVAVVCVLYAAVTDGQPPVTRATVMVLAYCLARLLSRRAMGFNTLAAAGLVVLAMNPVELFQTGTQLSFLAVGVLVYVAERLAVRPPADPLTRLIAGTRPWYERLGRRAGANLWQSIWATTLIWLIVAPLIMARFHLVSPVAVVLGPVLAIPVTLAMASGFGVFVLGWIAPPVAEMLGRFCDWNLSFMQYSVEAARAWPASHFWVSGPGGWWLAVFYGAIVVAVVFPAWRLPPRWTLGLVAGWSALGIAVSLAAGRDVETLRCTFLSVGHGTAVVVELPGGQTLLYDAGRLGTPTAAARAVSHYLWSRGRTHLDAIVISHADADHYNAVPAILEQFSVGAVYVSPFMFEERSTALVALREAIVDSGAPLREVYAGDLLRSVPDVEIEVLHPPRRGVLGSDNANSLVLAIEYQGRRILLTGDLEAPGINDVMAELPLDCDVVMAPHHGSAASDPPGTGHLLCGNLTRPIRRRRKRGLVYRDARRSRSAPDFCLAA